MGTYTVVAVEELEHAVEEVGLAAAGCAAHREDGNRGVDVAKFFQRLVVQLKDLLALFALLDADQLDGRLAVKVVLVFKCIRGNAVFSLNLLCHLIGVVTVFFMRLVKAHAVADVLCTLPDTQLVALQA